MASKRIQTHDMHASNVASNTPAALSSTVNPDLTARLRNVGMRTRKSVFEGYAMNPNPQLGIASPRAMSTGSLFQSSRARLETPSVPAASPRKRHRSASPTEEDIDTYNDKDSMALDARVHPDRPVKPLKKAARALSQSQSLPAGALFPSQGQSGFQGDSRKLNEEEEDWSSDVAFQGPAGSTAPFEPMSLS
ncbi:hypothetical protein BT96DRAFT_984014 [Gymnopus androsaceus JB14]|uniref:Uncharacterized protein n=1 Tax=Gymnopus androsaceus JB14 TaxID=1447944 RepID=A0A6A4ILR8_9AGAR|nr:hypothetical protein BT96DRAFT_984014 [Gymnopus androsaceus JB14]